MLYYSCCTDLKKTVVFRKAYGCFQKQRTKEAFYFQGMLTECDVNLMRASNTTVCLSPLKSAPVFHGQKKKEGVKGSRKTC